MYLNLKQETQRELERYNKTFDDVEWIGYFFPREQELNCLVPKESWDEFLDVDYDNGYGTEEIPTNLIVCGKDWWLEREEYDGSEWWEYKCIPNKPTTVCGRELWVVI